MAYERRQILLIRDREGKFVRSKRALVPAVFCRPEKVRALLVNTLGTSSG